MTITWLSVTVSLPTLSAARGGLGTTFYIRLKHFWWYLVCVICNCNSFLSTLFKLSTVVTWSGLYGSCIYNVLCSQSLSPVTLWVWFPLRWDVLNTKLCDKVCQCFVAGQYFSPHTPISSINNTDRQDIKYCWK